MKLPADVAAAVVRAAAVELADRLEKSVGLESLELFTMSEVAARLKVSEPKARQLVRDYVDLGEASKRISARMLRGLIEARTVSAMTP
jgi:hypothetical protein